MGWSRPLRSHLPQAGLARREPRPGPARTGLRAQERKKEKGESACETGGTCAGVAGAGLKIEKASDGFQESSMAQLTGRPLGMLVSESA